MKRWLDNIREDMKEYNTTDELAQNLSVEWKWKQRSEEYCIEEAYTHSRRETQQCLKVVVA